MRVVRIVSGILLITLAVLSIVTGGALWTVMRHEGADGAFGGPITGLSTPGFAIVVPDIDTLLDSHTSLALGSGTTVTIAAQGSTFVALAPLAAVQAYLGPVPYARVTSVKIGTGGVPVTLTPATPAPTAHIARGLPAAQRFWTRTGTAGRLSFTPGDHATAGLALVIMRTDAAPVVAVTATAEARAGWLGTSAWALLSLGTAMAIAGVTMLLWPIRRREVIYVVEPAQVPEIAERLGIAVPGATRAGRNARDAWTSAAGASPDARTDSGTGGVAATDGTDGVVLARAVVGADGAPADGARAVGARADGTPADGARAVGGAPAADDSAPADDAALPEAGESVGGVPVQRLQRPDGAPTSTAPAGAADLDGIVAGRAPVGPRMPAPSASQAPMPDAFADPDVRADSLHSLMKVQPPTRTNERGTYRSFGTPPPVTPAFRWTNADEAAAKEAWANADGTPGKDAPRNADVAAGKVADDAREAGVGDVRVDAAAQDATAATAS